MAWQAILPALVAGLGSLFSKNESDGSPTTTAEQRALQQQMLTMLNREQAYMTQMDPLRESVLRMAMGMLPVRYQTEGLGPAVFAAESSPWPSGGGGGAASGTTPENSQALGEGQPALHMGGGMSRGQTSDGGAGGGSALVDDYLWRMMENEAYDEMDARRAQPLYKGWQGTEPLQTGGGGTDWHEVLRRILKEMSPWNPAK